MAVTKTTTITALAGNLVVDFTADATSEPNITGNSSGKFYLIEIDNTANASSLAYVKIRDSGSNAVPGNPSTGIPTWQFVAPKGAKITYTFPEGQDYSAGLNMWCVTSPAHQNTNPPSNSVVVKIIAS